MAFRKRSRRTRKTVRRRFKRSKRTSRSKRSFRKYRSGKPMSAKFSFYMEVATGEQAGSNIDLLAAKAGGGVAPSGACYFKLEDVAAPGTSFFQLYKNYKLDRVRVRFYPRAPVGVATVTDGDTDNVVGAGFSIWAADNQDAAALTPDQLLAKGNARIIPHNKQTPSTILIKPKLRGLVAGSFLSNSAGTAPTGIQFMTNPKTGWINCGNEAALGAPGTNPAGVSLDIAAVTNVPTISSMTDTDYLQCRHYGFKWQFDTHQLETVSPSVGTFVFTYYVSYKNIRTPGTV